MRSLKEPVCLVALLVVVSIPALCQLAVPVSALPAAQPAPAIVPESASSTALNVTPATPALQALLAFKESDVKFSIAELMDILRDKRHEGWVLAAYPDPKTSRPLIGAGFSLDLPEREHPQLDPLNPNSFIEPSSAELWQAAGLDRARLAEILDQFHERQAAWTARSFRRDIPYLPAQITDDDADKLLREAIVQSIINARAYCRNFDQLTASQQMALSQLVYQMGVNLQEFTEFLGLINNDTMLQVGLEETAQIESAMRDTPGASAAYWEMVQHSLEQSQWARLYRARAVAVVAMFDPQYAENPAAAERRVSAVLHPVRRRRGGAATSKLAADRSPQSHSARSKRAHALRRKRA
jgi:hypothetical protein